MEYFSICNCKNLVDSLAALIQYPLFFVCTVGRPRNITFFNADNIIFAARLLDANSSVFCFSYNCF